MLIACEESQAVCKAFRERGFEAYSCDIQECSGGHPEWHICGNVLPILNGNCVFQTQAGSDFHVVNGKWDLIIAHLPCTRLCGSGQRWLYYGSVEYQLKKRMAQIEAIAFFMRFVDYAETTGIPMAIENPIGIMSTKYRKPDFIYNPYDFEGETECKKTCIWTFNGLPTLKPTQNLPKEQRTHGIWRGHFEIDGDQKKLAWNDPLCAKMRSVTPNGVAKAMAEQWGDELLRKGNNDETN